MRWRGEARGLAGLGVPIGCMLWSPCFDLAGLTRSEIDGHRTFRTNWLDGDFME